MLKEIQIIYVSTISQSLLYGVVNKKIYVSIKISLKKVDFYIFLRIGIL